jgi:hypothetical protein
MDRVFLIVLAGFHVSSLGGARILPSKPERYFGSQTEALISPNSRGILRHNAQASSVT